MKSTKKGKGNIQAQRKRRKKRLKEDNILVPYLEEEYETIDFNLTHTPYAYCKHYHGYLTYNQAKIHDCHCKQGGNICPKMQLLYEEEIQEEQGEENENAQ